ncbi:MAG TPA: hypothetical protein VG944_20885 [Fimbriimonas sp.]|nr:hypothetical protein [Fimbriimonas sp.]
MDRLWRVLLGCLVLITIVLGNAACGGGDRSHPTVDKHVTVVFVNDLGVPLTFTMSQVPGGHWAVNANSQLSVPSFHLVIDSGGIETWAFHASGTGVSSIEGDYQWTQAAGENNNTLQVTVNADQSWSFLPESN